MKPAMVGLTLATALVLACDFNLTDPNSPSPLGPNATVDQVRSAAVGTLVALRVDFPRWVLNGAILGREGYRLDTADPRFTTELLHGPLDPSNDAFGGGQWATQFRTIKSGYGILNVIGSAKLDTNAAKNTAAINSVRGYVHTIQALAFLMVLNSHTEDSIPIDVNHSLPSLAPLVTNDSAYRHVISLLDSARTELQAAGTAFPFDPGPSFADFNTPATFLKFNRGLAARAWAYRASPFKPGANCAVCWDSAAAALGASFLAPAASLDLGAYISFGTGNQDTPNPLAQAPGSAINLVHPFIKDSAEFQSGSTTLRDRRFLARVTARPDTFSLACLSSALSWIHYPTPISSIPIIRNEELILLDAEAQWFKAVPNKLQAVADLNTIRQTSGGLVPTTVTAASTDSVFINDLLKQRLYSLLYEGGHRWIDMRRYGRLSQVKRDRPTGCAATKDTVSDKVFSTLPINSFEVQARQ